MTGAHVHLKKHWKPPFLCSQLTIFLPLLLLLLIGQVKIVEAQNESSLPNDDIIVNTESTAYTIRFSLSNNEKYELLNVTCKGIKNVEHVGNKDHICENLDPCSQYFSTVTIKNLMQDADPAIIERTIEVGTEYAAPETYMNPPIPGKEFINLTWSATNRACIKSFQIEAVSADKQSTNKNSVANDISEQKIEILFPCQEYNIQLKTEDVNNTIVSNQTATTNTLYAEPEIITVNIENYDNAQVKVSWEPPKYKTCVKYFYLKWTRTDCKDPLETDSNDRQSKQQADWDDSFTDGSFEETTIAPTVSPPGFETANTCVWYANITDANAKEYVIGNLQGCEDYDFQIYINNNLTTKYEPQSFISPEQAPGIVTANTVLLNATTATISWNPPKDHSKCVKLYRIYTTGPLQRAIELQETQDMNITETVATFEDLEPCGHYNYTVFGISHNDFVGESMNYTYDTLEDNPTRIRNYNVSEEAYNITITWDPPIVADLCLNGYRVIAWGDENIEAFSKVTNDTTIVVDGLNSCQWYTVQIIATTQTKDGEVQRIEAETRSIVSEAPKNFQAIGLYPNSFELSATEASVNNKCETIFARFTCELTKNVDVIYKRAEQYVEGQVGGITFKALLSPLSPFTEYKCNVGLFNIAGWSANRTIIERTEPYFPQPPEKVNEKSSTNSSINFSWKAPKYANGNIKLYISHFQRVTAGYYVPPGCESIASDPFTRETSSLEQLYPNLKPYTVYSIQVAAQNEYGVGEYTMPYMVKTQPWISDPITNLKILSQGPYASVTEYKANVIVSWNTPCKSNGDIESFVLEFVGDRLGYDTLEFQRIVSPRFNKMGNIEYNETDLKPEFNYTVSVAIKVYGVEQLSAGKYGAFESPAGIPERLDEKEAARTKVDAYEANNPTNSAVVRFPTAILNSESGSILYVALLLSEKHCNQDPELRFGALDTNIDWPNSPSWNEAYEASSTSCIHQYQTTPIRWQPNPIRTINSMDDSYSRYSRDNDEIEYVIGTETCDDTSKHYCNGPLKPNTEYNLVIRLFTKSGFNDASMLEFKTDSLIQLTVILISVISCLLLAFIAGFIYLWITKRIIWQRASYHGIEDSFGDVVGKNFAIFYRDVSKPEKVQREFKELTVVAMDLSYSASEIGCNKNRYADIFPYDKNRVILDIDAEGSDYINASFIDGYRRKKEYIATQGPKPESTLDFWRMILQHNVRVIVQVTQFREGDCIKCHEYFPYKSKTINVSVKKRDSFEIYDRTEMSLTHDKYSLKQKVTHYYFKKWPDHGCPKDPMHLITFVRKVKAERVPSYSPIVVHCSAGVGRTGTFIGLDIIMQRLRGESKINIYETVKKLRFQRMKMVQTLAQYSFLYSCAYELVKHKNTRAALKYQNHHSDKKVSFQEDPEVNGIEPVQVKTLKFNGRRSGSDLSSVDEHNHDSDLDGNSIKQVEVPSYGVRTRFNTMRKSSADADADDEDSVRADNTESVM